MLFQDEPYYGLFLRLLFLILPGGLATASLGLWSTGEEPASAVLLGEATIMGLIFWAVLPRAYQVFDNHLTIALGGSLSVRIGFEDIVKIEITDRASFGMNFTTDVRRKYVLISKKQGLSIAITPRNDPMFVENANNAFKQWTEKSNSARTVRKPF